ncbi:hypothetical protein [Ferruginivarius sediminum]|uniref:hypothetical protein n=1 Tax=Ferruginivarius sediminum TaxID=2661937 RepID=UPI0011C04C70|nr:hypothetical protein [Ferruginivarius sediminum]
MPRFYAQPDAARNPGGWVKGTRRGMTRECAMPDKSYRNDVTPAQAEERHQAFAMLLRTACRTINEQGRGDSLRNLERAVQRIVSAYGE